MPSSGANGDDETFQVDQVEHDGHRSSERLAGSLEDGVSSHVTAVGQCDDILDVVDGPFVADGILHGADDGRS